MVSLRDAAVQFARRYPSPAAHPLGPSTNRNWDNDCGMFVVRFARSLGAFNPSVTGPTAYDVYRRTQMDGRRATDAPVGSFQWFGNVRGGKPGHVGVVTGVGGKFASATTARTGSLLWSTTPNLREMTAAQYVEKLPYLEYLGWSYDYAGARIDMADFAGDVTTPIPDDREDDDMKVEMISWRPTPTTRVWAIIGPGYWEQINRLETANARRVELPLLGDNPTREVTTAMAAVYKAGLSPVAAVQLTDAQLAKISAGVKVDLSSVLDAIRQSPTTTVNLIKQWVLNGLGKS